MEYLEKSNTRMNAKHIRKKIDYKKPSNAKRKKIQVWECKAVDCLEIRISKVSACSFCFYLFVLC